MDKYLGYDQLNGKQTITEQGSFSIRWAASRMPSQVVRAETEPKVSPAELQDPIIIFEIDTSNASTEVSRGKL